MMPSTKIQIQVNGDSRVLPRGATVADLLTDLDLSRERVAVEHNREILSRRHFDEVRLADGDRLEIVHFVGGGCRRHPSL